MSNVVTLPCILCNEVQPTFGAPGTKTATHCKKCKTPEMVDIKSRMCSVCHKVQPIYSDPSTKTASHCFKCKTSDMINIKHQKCSVCNKKRPNYGLEGSKKPTHCASCKSSSMVDLVHTMCKTPLCSTRADQSVYDGHCVRCAVHNGFDVKRNYKTKEKYVVDIIKAEFPDIDWKSDKGIEGACSRRRGDLHADLGYLYLIIEVDESQHRGYAELCDKRRYHEIAHDVYSSSGERPIVFLRFNPDGYLDSSNTRITTPWKQLKSGLWSIGKDRIIEFLDRSDILTRRIEYYLDEDNIPSAPLIVETMFYDNHNPESPVVSLSLDGRI